jgi:putative MFS transporter
VIFFAPESYRYLQRKGKTSEALALLKKHNIDTSGIEVASKPVSLPQKRQTVLAGLKELWSPRYRRRSLLLWIVWAVLVYTYHGIFTWLPTFYASPPLNFTVVTSIQWVLVVTLAQVPGYYSAALLLDKAGRKPIAFVYLFFAAVGSVLLSAATGEVTILFWSVSTILLWSVVISFFNLGAWSALYAYTPELYSTRVRGTGTGAAASIGRLAGVVAPTATPLLYTYGGLPAAFAVFALFHFLGAIAVLVLGTETKGKVLEEISKD